MRPYFSDDAVTLYAGDCRDILADLDPASVDAVVTDPPYELGFMGRAWDSLGIAYDVDVWRQCWDALKPGGHLLAFGGTRTYHRMVCAIEDAGFEIRDSLHWITGQGFPKSLNVNKDARFCQCDLGELSNGDGELRGVRQAVPDVSRLAEASEVPDLFASMQREGSGPGLGSSRAQGPGSSEDDSPAQVRSGQPSLEGGRDLQTAEGELHRPEVRPLPAGANGNGQGGWLHHGTPAGHGSVDRPSAAADGVREPHRPQSPEQRPVEPGAVSVERRPQARRGWPVCGGCGKPSIPPGLGTALRPAHEPIVLARKPFPGTVAENVLMHGTGALNIDACRTVSAGPHGTRGNKKLEGFSETHRIYEGGLNNRKSPENPAGRWPTNVVLTHQPLVDDTGNIIGDACENGCVPGCPVADMDAQSGIRKAGAHPAKRAGVGYHSGASGTTGDRIELGDGGASRFFPVFRYEAKAPASERPRGEDGTAHATVKPLALMRWLVRLATQPGGVVLDPFLGSGTTAEACVIEGFRCVGIERDESHLPLIKARLSKPIQPTLGEAS